MIVDGRALAEEIFARTKQRAEVLPRKPRLVALMGEPTPATLSYLRIKERRAGDAGFAFETHPLGAEVNADALIVQLPLPAGIDQKKVCDAIPLAEDADVLSSAAREAFARGDAGALLPPVVGAIKEIFDAHDVVVRGKKAVVIGSGFLVGGPAATWLTQRGAEVTVIDSPSEHLPELLQNADIIVSGTGSPHLVKPEMLKTGVVLIDAGTSESGGQIVGDADPACADKCALFTPVPGGVGPIAVACLFANAVALAEKAMNRR